MSTRQDDTKEPSQILEHVFLGSRTHARDKELLQRLCITHVLNVTPSKKMDPVAGVPNFFDKDKLFTYRRCAVFDNKAEDISGVLEGCIAFIDQAKYYGRILVHCNKGISRSSSMVIAYLMKLRLMSFEQALAFVIERRSIAKPNENFCRQLQEYERRLYRSTPKEKSARAVRGPVGPQLPPIEESSQDCAAAIGPQLPSHLMRAQEDDKVVENINAAMLDDKEKMISGPNLLPNLKRERVQLTEVIRGDTTSTKKKKMKCSD